MKRNDHPEFAGVEGLKKKHKWQLLQFKDWSEKGSWSSFHTSHYDWWMFPISKGSSQGYAWTVFEYEISELKSDSGFMSNYLLGVELLMLSWGWDLYQMKFIEEPSVGQAWHNWPIRLHKCASSLQLFGMQSEFQSVKEYADHLMQQGVSFEYNGKDLRRIFIEKS